MNNESDASLTLALMANRNNHEPCHDSNFHQDDVAGAVNVVDHLLSQNLHVKEIGNATNVVGEQEVAAGGVQSNHARNGAYDTAPTVLQNEIQHEPMEMEVRDVPNSANDSASTVPQDEIQNHRTEVMVNIAMQQAHSTLHKQQDIVGAVNIASAIPQLEFQHQHMEMDDNVAGQEGETCFGNQGMVQIRSLDIILQHITSRDAKITDLENQNKLALQKMERELATRDARIEELHSMVARLNQFGEHQVEVTNMVARLTRLEDKVKGLTSMGGQREQEVEVANMESRLTRLEDFSISQWKNTLRLKSRHTLALSLKRLRERSYTRTTHNKH